MILFSALFQENLHVHGLKFCWDHYVRKGGMKRWEFRFWARKARGVRDFRLI